MARPGRHAGRLRDAVARSQGKLDRAGSDRALTREAVEVRLSVLRRAPGGAGAPAGGPGRLDGRVQPPPDPSAHAGRHRAARRNRSPRPCGRPPAPPGVRAASPRDRRTPPAREPPRAAAEAQARSLADRSREAPRAAPSTCGPLRPDRARPGALRAPGVRGLGGPLVPSRPEGRSRRGSPRPSASADDERSACAGSRPALPLRRPIRGDHAVSSAFGTRLDPFTRGLALHTGLDLKAEYGEPPAPRRRAG